MLENKKIGSLEKATNYRKMNFKNEKVLIIGHTGFKGSWLANWLSLYDAKIYGISKFSINMILIINLQILKKIS